jgi:hypothetical protein
MMPEWSYINNFFFYKNVKTTNQKFVFKVFRKNTRFKKYKQGNTFFTRKVPILQRRRLNLKPYFRVSLYWVRYNLKYKKVTSFFQNKLMYQYTSSYPQLNILTKNLNNKVINIGEYSINFVSLTNNILNFFFKKKTKRNLLLTSPSASFNELPTPKKLNLLGFSFHGLRSLNSCLPLINFKDTSINDNSYNILNPNTQLNNIIIVVVSVRFYLIIYTLYKIYLKKV